MQTTKNYKDKYSDITQLFEASVDAEARSLVTERDATIRKNAVEAEESESPNTAPERLAELANSEYFLVRMRVARHPNTPKETLEALSKDPDGDVRSIALRAIKDRETPTFSTNTSINIDDFTTSAEFLKTFSDIADSAPEKASVCVSVTLDEEPLLDISIKKRTGKSRIPVSLQMPSDGWRDFSCGAAAASYAYAAMLPFVREALLSKETDHEEEIVL